MEKMQEFKGIKVITTTMELCMIHGLYMTITRQIYVIYSFHYRFTFLKWLDQGKVKERRIEEKLIMYIRYTSKYVF